MSEKQQHNAAIMREKMINRYGDGLHHKHDKLHNPYRMHYRTHPVLITHTPEQEKDINCSTGNIRATKLRRIRKRLDKGRFH